MKRNLLLCCALTVCLLTSAQNMTRTRNGMKIDIPSSGICEEVIVYSPGIIRVVKYPSSLKEMPAKKSYSVIMQPEKCAADYSEKDGTATLSTANITVRVDEQSGCISFFSHQGEPLLKEKEAAGKDNCSVEEIQTGVNKGKYKVSQSYILDKNEAIFGLGQRQCPVLNQRGEHVMIWSGNTNITIPYFTSEKGYGLYWDNAGKSFFDDSETETSFRSEVAAMTDYYLMYQDGTQDGVVAQIRALSGQATMFPLWTMGHWQCRERYKSTDELCDVIDKYRELHIPLDGIVQDWQYWGCDSNWNAMRFMNPHYINKMGDKNWSKYLPNDEDKNARYADLRIKTPADMLKYAHEKNTHLMISIWASFGPWTEQYKALDKMGALLPFDTWPRNAGVKPYDVFNPKARDLYWKYLTSLYDMGIDAWWTDSSEPDHFEKPGDNDYITYDGSWLSVKNAFPLMHNMGIYEHQRAMKGNNKRSVQMTRCGAFGLQHYGTFSWSGDVVSNWDVMKNQIPSGLNYVICGIPYWNTDIGGFFGWDYGNDPKNPAMQELQVRWMQWGAFMPLMRNHCSSPMVDELYRFGNPGDWAFDVQKQYIQLRYRMLPYIYSNAGDVVQGNGSMIRPLVMDFAKDKKAINRNDEYLFGRSILVRPVTDPLYTWNDENKKGHLTYPDISKASAAVKVYLPAGTCWYDFWTNEKRQGGQEISRACPITTMPVYVRAGAIIPFGEAVEYSSEKPWDNLEIRVYPGADGTFTLYEDEGDNYHYEKGAFTQITFSYNDAARTLTIADRKGSYKGMLKNRKFHIILVDGTTPTGEKACTNGKTIEYKGKKILVNM